MHTQEYARRRRHLMELIGIGGIAVVPTAPERPRSRDVHFPYRPDSDFYYLTGFEEPESVAVLMPGRPHGAFVVFCREDEHAKSWFVGSLIGRSTVCPIAESRIGARSRNRLRAVEATIVPKESSETFRARDENTKPIMKWSGSASTSRYRQVVTPQP